MCLFRYINQTIHNPSSGSSNTAACYPARAVFLKFYSRLHFHYSAGMANTQICKSRFTRLQHSVYNAPRNICRHRCANSSCNGKGCCHFPVDRNKARYQINIFCCHLLSIRTCIRFCFRAADYFRQNWTVDLSVFQIFGKPCCHRTRPSYDLQPTFNLDNIRQIFIFLWNLQPGEPDLFRLHKCNGISCVDKRILYFLSINNNSIYRVSCRQFNSCNRPLGVTEF